MAAIYILYKVIYREIDGKDIGRRQDTRKWKYPPESLHLNCKAPTPLVNNVQKNAVTRDGQTDNPTNTKIIKQPKVNSESPWL